MLPTNILDHAINTTEGIEDAAKTINIKTLDVEQTREETNVMRARPELIKELNLPSKQPRPLPTKNVHSPKAQPQRESSFPPIETRNNLLKV